MREEAKVQGREPQIRRDDVIMDMCIRKTRIPIQQRKQKEPEGGFMETDLSMTQGRSLSDYILK